MKIEKLTEDKIRIIIDASDIKLKNLDIKVDMAFIPIGGTYTMDALSASEFVNKLKPKVVVPIHYGMVVGDESDLNRFIENVNSDIEVRILL